jgi:hypothetical protein
MSQFDWPITQKKKVETMEAAQNRRFQKILAWANTYPHYKLGVLIYLFIYSQMHSRHNVFVLIYLFIYSQVHSCHNVLGTRYKSCQERKKRKKKEKNQ